MTVSAEESPGSSAEEAIRRARVETMAAYAIATTPECEPQTAAPHVVRAWHWLFEAEDRPSNETAGEGEELAKWASLRAQGKSSPGDAEVLRTWIERSENVQGARDVPTTPRQLRQQLDVLRRVLEEESRKHGLIPSPRLRGAIWSGRFALWGGLMVAVLLVALRPWELVQVGPWRGAYYPGKDLRGDPDVRREADLSFDWGRDPPTDSIPSDRFGAAWDTCLVLPEEQEVAFQLVVDDGAKLLIDGDVVIDAWKIRPPGAKGTKKTLPAGVHHLRVEYHEESKGAFVHLRASFDPDVPPGPIPARMLEYPGDDVDEAEPCGDVDP